MKLPVILAAFALCISLPCKSQWTQTSGPVGGDVRTIVKLSSYMFLNAGPGGIFRSNGNGDHWEAANIGLPLNPHCYALASNGTVLYAAIYANGVYKSVDFGSTWSAAGNALGGKTFYSLLADANDVYAGESSGGFYYSGDGGSTWTKKGTDLGQVRNFLLTGGSLFIAAYNKSGLAGVFKSTDKGSSLTDLHAPITSVNAMNGYDNAIYVVGGQPTAISRDFGTTWTTSSVGATGDYSMTSIYANQDSVVIPAGNSTLFVSTDEGVNWQTITSLNYNGQVNAIYIDNSTILLGSREGIYRSTDNATSWTENNNGLTNLVITHLEATDDIAFAGTDVGIFSSTDNGSTWTKRNQGLEDNSAFGFLEGVVIKGIHINQNQTVIATSKGVFKSNDNGISWTLKKAIEGTDLNNRFQSLAGDRDRIFASESGQQYYSASSGESWSKQTDPIFNNISIIKAKVKNDTIVVLTDNKIIISKSFGTAWQSARVTTEYFFPTDATFFNGKLYVATYQGLYSSPDMIAWTKISLPPNGAVLSLASGGTALYAGTEAGVYISNNSGKTWHPVNEGMPDKSPTRLVLNTENCLAGTYGMSVWSSSRDQLNITGIEEIREEVDLFPNPSSKEINIKVPGMMKSYQVTDLTGRRVLQNEMVGFDGGVYSIDVSNLPAGIYFIELQGHRKLHRRFAKE